MFLIIFALVCCWGADLVFKYKGKDRRYTKPFLIPLILVLYISCCFRFHVSVHPAEVVALVFGWIGDISLMGKSDRSFLIGLCAFLIGHVAYLLMFLRLHVPAVSAKCLMAVLFYAAYASLFYHSLMQYAQDHWKKPIVFYIVMISSMSLCACLLHGDISLSAWGCLWGGSLLFMISDSLVAWEKFADPSIHGVMETYVSAQVLIMIGVLLLG